MMSRSSKRRNVFDIFDFPADPPPPSHPRPRPNSRLPRAMSVTLPPPSRKGKLTTAERLKLAKRQNSKRLSLSQHRQRLEREKAEACRRILVRRKEDPDLIWDLTNDVTTVNQNQPTQPDELVSDDDEEDFVTPRIEVRKRLFASPDREPKPSRQTAIGAVQQCASCNVTEILDDHSVPTRLKKRRTTEPSKRIGIPITSSVFAPNVRTAVSSHTRDQQKADFGVQKRRIPFKAVNRARKVSPPRSTIARSLEEERLQTERRHRRPELNRENRGDFSTSRDILLNISTSRGYRENLEDVYQISDDDDTRSHGTSATGPGPQQALKRPRHWKQPGRSIPARTFYQKKNMSRANTQPRTERPVVPLLKSQLADVPSEEIAKLKLDSQKPSLSENAIETQIGKPSRRNPRGRIQYDSSGDEYESAISQETDIRLKPLSKPELAVVRSLTFKVSKNKIMARIPEANIELKAGDFSGLRGSRWLNDEILNSFVSLINERNISQVGSPVKEDTGENENDTTREEDDEVMEVTVTSAKPMEVFRRPRPRTHVFNTFFFPRLSQHGYDYGGVRRWLKKAGRSVKELDLIMFPINLSNFHWVLAAIDLRGKQFLYLDSMYGKDSSGTIPLLRKWLHDEVADKYGEEVAEGMQIDSWGSILNPSYLPRQQDGGSCGVFTLYTAEYLERGRRPDFTQQNILTLRQRTALFLKCGRLPDS